ncbi:hypothetical protein OF83DRAFT_919696 [Amylostereum chailletii]|nr:hypothetical protein OF83DRAFT_919696 [Amylostereum chailletii]
MYPGRCRGGALAVASTDIDKKQLGDHIFIAGLALQPASFLFFTATLSLFIWRVYRLEPKVWTCDARRGWLNDWRALAATIVFSCICITVRRGSVRW